MEMCVLSDLTYRYIGFEKYCGGIKLKRKAKIISLLLIFVLLFSVNVASQEITQKEAKNDLHYLINRIEEVHPNIYFHLSENDAENRIDILKNELNKKEKWSKIEIYRMFSPFLASFKDGHTRFEIWNQINQYYNNGGKVIPIDIKFIGDQILLYKNYKKSDMEKDIEILAINGIEIEKIIDTLAKRISHKNRVFAYANIERLFPLYLWANFDFNEEYNLKLKKSDGEIFQTQLKGITQKERNKLKEEKTDNWLLDFPESKSAFLTVNTFNGTLKDEFEKDMDAFFKEIANRDINNLFIDISENGGGNTDLARYLFEYIYNKPYNLFEEVKIKYSDYTAQQKFNFFSNIYYNVRKNEDNIIVFKPDEKIPEDKEFRFNGNVYIITSNYTFSTAADFAAMVKDYNAGKIIGEETGGLASTYGDVIQDELPNSELNFGVSYKYFLRPAGFDDGQGVKPDKEININKIKYWHGKDKYQKRIVRSIIY